MTNSIQQIQQEERKLVETFTLAIVPRQDIRNKRAANFFVFEKEIGKFPKNLQDLGKKLLRLQGYDSDVFYKNANVRRIEHVHETKTGDRVFILTVIV